MQVPAEERGLVERQTRKVDVYVACSLNLATELEYYYHNGGWASIRRSEYKEMFETASQKIWRGKCALMCRARHPLQSNALSIDPRWSW